MYFVWTIAGFHTGKGNKHMEAMQRLSQEGMLAELERRVKALERHTGERVGEQRAYRAREDALLAHYGEFVDKTTAAAVLRVSRATVYAMLEDGRIMGACGGRKVDVRSIARYLSSPGKRRSEQKAEGRGGHECN